MNVSKNNIPFSKILYSLKNGDIQKLVVVNEKTFIGSYKNGKQFKSSGLVTDLILHNLNNAQDKHCTQYSLEYTEKNLLFSILLSIFPFLFILSMIFFFTKQLQVGGGQAMSFGKSQAKLLTESQKVTFNDVAGIDECKSELEEVVEFLKSPGKFTQLGGKIPKGILLIGSPGTGKTLLARAVAGEADVPFFSVSGSDFVEMFVGVGASRVRDLFKQGKKRSPCIIFIDEIDAVGRQRGSGMGGGNDEREQTLNQLLVEMDGFEVNNGIIIIAATNRADVLDSAILRPGRFDRQVIVPLPDMSARERIFEVHTKKIPLCENVVLGKMAKMTPGMSGADIANLVNEAALSAARNAQTQVTMNDLERAQEKVIMGVEKNSLTMNYKEYHKTAYHESGHAIVTTLLPDIEDPVHKLSIIPRGQALGVTINLPQRDRYSISKKYLDDQLCILMSGRVAEELIFNELSSGASNDFEKATSIAKKMVCDLGMSKNLGPIIYGEKYNRSFIGEASKPSYSEATGKKIDDEIKNIISVQYNRSRYILESNIDILHKVANTLIDYETISGEELKLIISGYEMTRARPRKKIKIE